MFQESASAVPSSIWASMNSWFTPTVLFLLLNVVIGTIALMSTLANQNQHHNQQQNEHHHPRIARSPSVLQRLKSINFYAHYRSQEPQNPSVNHKPNMDSGTLYGPDRSQNLETQSNYFFEEAAQENLQIPQPQDAYVFEETHKLDQQETDSRSFYEQNDSNLDGFQHAHEETAEENDQLRSMDEIYSQLKGSQFNRSKSDPEPASSEIQAKLSGRMRKSTSLKTAALGRYEEENGVEARRPATVRERGSSKVTEGDEGVDAKADDFINKFRQQLKLQRLDSILRYKDKIRRGLVGS